MSLMLMLLLLSGRYFKVTWMDDQVPEYFLRKTCVTCSSSAVLFMNLNLDHVRLHETENVSVTQLHIQPGASLPQLPVWLDWLCAA